MQFCKLQFGCLVVLLYIAFIYMSECRKYKIETKGKLFPPLLAVGIVSVIFDMITEISVNYLEVVDRFYNNMLHLFFTVAFDASIFVLLLYMLVVTGEYPEKRTQRVAITVPFILNVIFLFVNLGDITYEKGIGSNYASGGSIYTCFFMAGLYTLMILYVFIRRWRYIESTKRLNLFTYLAILSVVLILQFVLPNMGLTSLAIVIFIVGIYMNEENPAIERLSHYHEEMVMGFAVMIETRDSSTGGHVKRTSRYVRLIAEELHKRGRYKDVITSDYINNLVSVAPMHDIGKISIPDSVLCKTSGLTNEEFSIMKMHTINGANIIIETFANLRNKQFLEMAYNVAAYHHEKWNGNGYPKGLSGTEIPLSARIMAVADVFDAVAEKRCYRNAMPMDKCFEIIRNGSGKDFDPIIAEAFLSIADEVERVHNEFIVK